MNARLARGLRASLIAAWACLGCQGILGIEDAEPREDNGGNVQKCTLNSDCSGARVCLFAVCSQPCKTDRDCPTNSRCLSTTAEGENTACVSTVQAACAGDGECPKGTKCQSGQCRTFCGTSLSGCRTDQVCSSGACLGTLGGHDPDRVPEEDAGGGGASGAGGETGTGGAPVDSGDGAGGTETGGAGGSAGGAGGAGGAGTGGAPSGIVLQSGSIVTAGLVDQPVSGILLRHQAVGAIDARTCGGGICVVGGVTP